MYVADSREELPLELLFVALQVFGVLLADAVDQVLNIAADSAAHEIGGPRRRSLRTGPRHLKSETCRQLAPKTRGRLIGQQVSRAVSRYR